MGILIQSKFVKLHLEKLQRATTRHSEIVHRSCN